MERENNCQGEAKTERVDAVPADDTTGRSDEDSERRKLWDEVQDATGKTDDQCGNSSRD